MSRTLFLLVTSERPDAYLNSVVHCLLYEGVRRVEFLSIQGFGESLNFQEPAQRHLKSATVWLHVNTLLKELATEGEYRIFAGDGAEKNIPLNQFYTSDQTTALQEVYRQCLQMEVQWSHRDITYPKLRQEIAAIAKMKPAAIVDVSSIKKTFLGDLVASGVTEGLDSLYTFDLVHKPDHDKPWTMLFHDLKPTGKSEARYRYINLLDTPIFRECSRSLLIRRSSLPVTLVLSVALFAGALIAYFVNGPSSLLVQVTALLSSVSSILSLFYNFFPLRR